MRMLDLEAVQAFVLTADLKSFTRAAEAMDSTQSAVSLKIKRLEDALGRRLLERTPRLVRLSQDGSAFLGPARDLVAAHAGAVGSFGEERRRLSVGMSHHIVGAELPRLLRQMRRAEPALTLEIRIGSSREILDAFEDGALDAAVILRHDSRRTDGEVLMEEPFGWMAASDLNTAAESRSTSPHRPSHAACAKWPSPCWMGRALRGRKCSLVAAWAPSVQPWRPGWLSPHSADA